jgi:Family of unknown function (DUF6879)
VLTENELGTYIDERLTRSAFRLELRDLYDTESERPDFARFLRGEPITPQAQRRPWLDRLRAEAEAGILNQRVHVLRTPLTDYLRFEAEWGYVYNAAAGEDIRIIDLADRPLPAGLTDHDFWLVDDTYPIRMLYSSDGRFTGAEPVTDPGPYQRTRAAAIAASEPFTSWWRRHTEEWRDHRAA